MRLSVLLIALLSVAGCSAMLMSGSAEHERPSDCTEREKEANERGCK